MENEKDEFRNHLATADDEGKRLWVYARKPKGKFYSARTWLSVFQIALLICVPFAKIGDNPLFLFDVFERKFILFGEVFLMRDFPVFALITIAFFIGIALFTAIYGRVFCGWACPQTLFLEMVFRKVEYLIEGDGPEQRRNSKLPLRGKRLLKRLLKLMVFFAIAFVLSNVFLAYIVGGDELLKLISDGPASNFQLFSGVVGFSLLFFWHFTWFREQFCTFLCPYARLQSVLMDDNSIAVAYDHKRGETRASNRKRKVEKLTTAGDCVDCGLCVQVCPTGIDIRNGFPQLECVNCTACIDACDKMMVANDKEPGLIRYSSINMIENGEKFKLTGRIKAYTALLLGLCVFIVYLLSGRSPVDATVIRAHGSVPMYQDGQARNLFFIKFINKLNEDVILKLKIEDSETMNFYPSDEVTLKANEMKNTNILINSIDPGMSLGKNEKIRVGIYLNDKLIETRETTFLYPRFSKQENK